MRHVFSFALIVLAVGVGGCRHQAADVRDEGPVLTLTPATQAAYRKYLGLPGPLAFAVSEDGNSAGYIYCAGGRAGGCPDRSRARSQAVESCRSTGTRSPCGIFAEGKTVVWDGPVVYGDKAAAGAPSAPTAPPPAPTGMSEMSGFVQTGWRNYRYTGVPLFFAVSETGTAYGARHCSGWGCDLRENWAAAMDACRKYSVDAPCRMYAIGKRVVWGETVDEYGLDLARYFPDAPKAGERPITMRWEGYGELDDGTVTLSRERNGGTLSVPLPDGHGECDGTYEFDIKGEGTWTAACTNGVSASGVVEIHSSGRQASGTGTDTEGRAIEFTIRARK